MMKNIFLVEDDEACEILLTNVVQSIDPNAHVYWAETAELAMEVLENGKMIGKKFDLIIVDIFLAGKSTGLDLWERCRRRFPETPILVTSGLSMHRFFEAIGQDTIAPPFLAKPFNLLECRQTIENLLSAPPLPLAS